MTTTTRIDEIEDGLYRISTSMTDGGVPGGFTFNQFLIVDDEPLLHHTGPRALFPAVRDAIARVLPLQKLRHVSLSHFEADECGALNGFLALAPRSTPLCGEIAKLVSVDDTADRPARGMKDGEELSLGRRTVRWMSTPHLPHAWECGHLFETTTRTLLCGDLFTQFGAEHAALTDRDILEPSEEARVAFDYYAHSKHQGALLEKLVALKPRTLACMHGASWRGDGAKLLRALGERLAAS